MVNPCFRACNVDKNMLVLGIGCLQFELATIHTPTENKFAHSVFEVSL